MKYMVKGKKINISEDAVEEIRLWKMVIDHRKSSEPYPFRMIV